MSTLEQDPQKGDTSRQAPQLTAEEVKAIKSESVPQRVYLVDNKPHTNQRGEQVEMTGKVNPAHPCP